MVYDTLFSFFCTCLRDGGSGAELFDEGFGLLVAEASGKLHAPFLFEGHNHAARKENLISLGDGLLGGNVSKWLDASPVREHSKVTREWEEA